MPFDVKFPSPSLAISRRTVLLGASGAGAALALGRMGSPALAQGLTSVKISEAIHLGIYVSVYAAKFGGFFKKHGLDVAVSSAGGIAAALPVVLSGNATFAVTGTGMSVNAAVEGAKISNIAKIVGGMAMWAVAKPGANFKTVDDFKGKTVATLRFPSSTIQVPTYVMKEKGGFEAEKAGVKFLQLPAGAQAQAVLDGRADVAVMFEWDASIAKQQFGLEAVMSLGDFIPPAAFTTAMLPTAEVTKNPAMVQAFCDALAETQVALHADRELFVKTSQVEFPQLSEAVIRSAAENILVKSQAIPKAPTISKAEWDADIAFEIAGGSLKVGRPYEEMVNNTFAEKAAAKFSKAG
jgi:NitT/TauT family transport system substrate-binding protein